ncbi:Heterogeneous nuclear ribonucleoprotein C [Varanus komodoensis]|uniref:heterogeneous nuclear ribonucleoprotein C-like n=1 Tax=Varanus komodoensis TaxID=61221 RepID=UPI001CF784B7|nr:heterogeneous nuclear ribonucleoprotein C-like [Varanus komodoensis]KAF7244563.1 Heterogeneous nuclear ribonucleoprotein C [Varanus komodoensis]
MVHSSGTAFRREGRSPSARAAAGNLLGGASREKGLTRAGQKGPAAWHQASLPPPLSGGMTLFGSREGCWRYLDMAREPKLSHTRPGQKRQHGGGLYPSSCDLDYDDCELFKDDLPYRVYEYQKIPPLISHIPIKSRRSHLGTGSKTSPGPHSGLRGNSNSTAGRTKLRAEELHSIKGELSQIKAQVDSLLESLDRMDQRREHPSGSKESKKKAPASAEAAYLGGDSARRRESTESDKCGPLQDIDSEEESTDTEEAARNHTLDPESSK